MAGSGALTSPKTPMALLYPDSDVLVVATISSVVKHRRTRVEAHHHLGLCPAVQQSWRVFTPASGAATLRRAARDAAPALARST